MPFDFHKDRLVYFQHQMLTTEKYIIPFIEQSRNIQSTWHILEIGCAEAGVLKAFAKRGIHCTGVDLVEAKLNIAHRMVADELNSGQIELVNKNIYEEEFKLRFKSRFDLIVLKDVIEHIVDQQNLMSYLHTFLKAEGIIFFAFPPWWMPFGGHQQMCKSFLSKIPYFHLLPMSIYRGILRLFRETPAVINGLTANKQTGINIEQFENILKTTGYQIMAKRYFLFNPIYEYKFNLTPKEQFTFISYLPYFRNFFTTGVYYLVEVPIAP